MNISHTFNYNQVQFDQDNEVILMTSLKAPKIKETLERAPLNLSLVLDVSGSMSGDKIVNLKKSVVKLIQQLSEKDTVGITIFTDFVEECFIPAKMTSDNKTKAIAEVNKLTAQNMTNMSGGMLKGFEQLKKTELVDGTIHRMLLFTDGQANEGLIRKEQFNEMATNQIKDTKMTISCFGYGADHNADILKNIADTGKGNFYYIDNVEDMGKTFARELGGLLSCCAQNITISLQMKKGAGEFIEVLNDLTVNSSDNQFIGVTFDDIYSEEEKHLLVKMKLNKVTKAITQRTSSVIKVAISYNDMYNKGKSIGIESNAKIKFVKKEDVQKDPTIKVIEQLAIIELAKAHLKAKEFADQGNFVAARGAYMQPGVYTACLVANGSKIGLSLDAHLGDALNTMSASSYTTSDSLRMSSTAKGLSSGRYVNADTLLFANSSQKSMEDEFEDKNSLLINGTTSKSIQTTQNTSPVVTITTTSNKGLSKKRSRA